MRFELMSCSVDQIEIVSTCLIVLSSLLCARFCDGWRMIGSLLVPAYKATAMCPIPLVRFPGYIISWTKFLHWKVSIQREPGPDFRKLQLDLLFTLKNEINATTERQSSDIEA